MPRHQALTEFEQVYDQGLVFVRRRFFAPLRYKVTAWISLIIGAFFGYDTPIIASEIARFH